MTRKKSGGQEWKRFVLPAILLLGRRFFTVMEYGNEMYTTKTFPCTDHLIPGKYTGVNLIVTPSSMDDKRDHQVIVTTRVSEYVPTETFCPGGTLPKMVTDVGGSFFFIFPTLTVDVPAVPFPQTAVRKEFVYRL